MSNIFIKKKLGSTADASSETMLQEPQSKDMITTASSQNSSLKFRISTKIYNSKWFLAVKEVFPLYLAIHSMVLLITFLSVFFNNPDNYAANPSIGSLWQTWNCWDTVHYLTIATQGYPNYWETAFFPLYSLLIRVVMLLIHDPLKAGLFLSNFTDLIVMVVFYQLLKEDFGHKIAQRAVLYLALFPTAFFFLAAYNESLFLSLALLCFYHQRRGQWWWAGLWGFSAMLTRSVGLVLLIPFCYEYLRQNWFQGKKLSFHVLSIGCIPAGLFLYALYCYRRYHDILAFSHAQAHWSHYFALPWVGMIITISNITQQHDLLSFYPMRSFIELVPDLFILVLLILSIVGPWRFKRQHLSYVLYGWAIYLFLQLWPEVSVWSLQSMSRYMLEVFPAFIILAKLGKYRIIHLNYLLVSVAGFFVLLMLFLMGHWIV